MLRSQILSGLSQLLGLCFAGINGLKRVIVSVVAACHFDLHVLHAAVVSVANYRSIMLVLTVLHAVGPSHPPPVMPLAIPLIVVGIATDRIVDSPRIVVLGSVFDVLLTWSFGWGCEPAALA